MQVIVGDCVTIMPTLETVDAIVTDPPYSLGFMGKAWDKTGVAFQVETWEAALRVLKPSGYLLAFGGTRTYHRLTCAIEDAGFEIRDCINWLYGSGFPKGKGCLKPAWEPIILARKPGKVLPLGIDECRIDSGGTHGSARSAGLGLGHKETTGNGIYRGVGGVVMPPHPAGRWPANVVHDGSDEVMEAFAVSGERVGSKTASIGKGSGRMSKVYGQAPSVIASGYDDTGTAAHFFYCAKASRRERDAGLEVLPEVRGATEQFDSRWKEGVGEDRKPLVRNHHPTVKPLKLMEWLVKLVAREGETVLDPFLGSGTTALACMRTGRHCIGIEQSEEYAEIAKRRLASYEPLCAS